MKQFRTYLSAIAFATLLMPAMAVAQKEKDAKDKEKMEKIEKEKTVKDKKGVEQIVITRDGNKEEKIVIEVNGDKVTINGKPAEDYKDGNVTVNRNRYKEMNALVRGPRGGARSWSGDDNKLFYSEDENRAMLGVVTEKDDDGAVIREVSRESAAEKAGLKEGDIITKVDDVKVEDADDVTKAIRSHKPGDKVTVTFLRDKKEQKITAELTKWKGMKWTPDSFGNNHNYNFSFPEMKLQDKIQGDVYGHLWDAYNGRPKLGVSVQDTEDGKGVKVIDVDDESNADKAGIHEDDVITAINDKEVNSADEVAKIVRENKDKPSLKLKLDRDGRSQTIDVKMPRKLKTADL